MLLPECSRQKREDSLYHLLRRSDRAMPTSSRDLRRAHARVDRNARVADCRFSRRLRVSPFRLTLALASLLALGNAQAQDAATAATAALPGSPVPPGVGLSPEAPHAAPAAGGRAPSFGAPVKKDAWAFTLGGSIFGWQTVGIGSKPSLPAPNSVSHPLHVPALIEGRQPF